MARLTSSLLALVILCMASSALAADSPQVQQATLRYTRDMDAAKRDYEAKLAALRADYETKTQTSRRGYIVSLKLAMNDATKAGDLDTAVNLKARANALEAEQVAVAWPGAFPGIAPPPVGPAPRNAPPQLAKPADTQPAAGKGKPIVAARGYVFEFRDEAKIREQWKLPTDPNNWSLKEGGINLSRTKSLPGEFVWSGDGTVQMVVTTRKALTINVYGQKVLIEALGFSGGKDPVYAITITRTGGKMVAKINEKLLNFNVTDDQPTRLVIDMAGETWIKGVKITAKELVPSPAPAPEPAAKTR